MSEDRGTEEAVMVDLSDEAEERSAYVSVRRDILVEFDSDGDASVALTAEQARALGKALIAAADELDQG